MKTVDSKERQRKIIISTVIFGVFIGLLSLTVTPKSNDSLSFIIGLFTFPFCTIAACICMRTGMCSIVFDFYDKIGFLLMQSLVYLAIGYLISKTRSRKSKKCIIKDANRHSAEPPDS
jgi:hypothetical protein